MPALSRRDFLKRSGLFGAAAIPLVSTGGAAAVYVPHESFGRAYKLADLHAAPSIKSRVVDQIMPDSLHPIVAADPAWYRLEGGYVPREAMQPIQPYNRPETVERARLPLWTEVVAPVAVLREWCACHAPLVARVGFGAVLYAMDHLIDDSKQVWYGIAAGPDQPLMGWMPALHAQVLPPHPPLYKVERGTEGVRFSPQTGSRITIKFEISTTRLSVYNDGQRIAQLPIATPALPRGSAAIQLVQPGMLREDGTPGRSWVMKLDNGASIYQVYGANWHNRFGLQHTLPTIELPVAAARWLYLLLATTADHAATVQIV